MPAIEVDGRAAWYGTGGVEWRPGSPCAVLVHGAGQDHSVWALQARSLSQHGWNVVAPDLPGHGRSEDVAGIDSVESYARWIEYLLLVLEAGPAAVVGHSMGACIGLAVAAREQQSVRSLALLGVGERMPVHPDLLDDSLRRPGRAHRFIVAFGHGRRAHFGGAETPGVWNLGAALALLESCSAAVLHRDFAACNAWDASELAAAVRCPTLVLAGEDDRMTPAKGGRKLAGRIEGAQFDVLEDCGHMMMAEAPTRVTRVLLAFLCTDGGASLRARRAGPAP